MNDIEKMAGEIAAAAVQNILCLDHVPTPETKLSKLGADSLDRIEIGMDVEERAGIKLTDADVEDLVTVADLAKVISGKMAASLTEA